MKISLAPIPYFWKRQAVFDFYRQLGPAPLDIIYLGETVCSKRREMKLADWMEIAGELAAAGKEVVLSTLGLMEAESELSSLRHITANGRFSVEANDMAAVRLLAGNGPFVIGPHVNVYNHRSLALFNEMGATRWVAPVELGRDVITAIQQARPEGMQTEMFGYGRLPLGFSARCFSARAHNRSKDECGFVCGEYEGGLPLFTQQDRPFLVLNGIQIQSAADLNLLSHQEELCKAGIDVFRIVPRMSGTADIARIIRRTLDGDLDPHLAEEQLLAYREFAECDGYWNQVAGMLRGQGIAGNEAAG